MRRQGFSGRNGLDRFAQAHLVADQHAPGAHGKQRTFGLVRVQRYLQQRLQPRSAGALREQRVQPRRAAHRIAASGDEGERVIVGAHLVTGACGQREKAADHAETLLGQAPVLRGVEQSGGRARERRRTIAAGAKVHRTGCAIAQVQLGEHRPIATRECAPGSTLLQPGNRS